MFVGSPGGEAGEVVDDARGVGVKDMRPVAMDQNPGLVDLVEGVAGDMITPVDQQHAAPQTRGDLLGHNGAGEAGPDNEIASLGRR